MARKPDTRDYFTAVFSQGDGNFSYRVKTEQDIRRRIAGYLERYPGAVGYLSKQTWQLDEQDGPTDMVSEDFLETINGGCFPVSSSTAPSAVSLRPRFARAEW